MNLYDSSALTTFTGKTFREAIDLLKEKLPQEAYKAIGGAADLTDISPAYMIEKVTEAFGPVGLGWRYGWPDGAIELKPTVMGQKDAWIAVITRFYLKLLMVQSENSSWSEPIPSTGASLNLRPEDALKGAVTRALGGAFSRLCWQVDVYKGLVSHRDGKKASRLSEGKPHMAESPQKAPETGAEPLETIQSTVPEQKVGPTDFWLKIRALGMTREAGRILLEQEGGSFEGAYARLV